MDMFFVIFLYFPVMMAVYTINGRRHQFYDTTHVFKSIFFEFYHTTSKNKYNSLYSLYMSKYGADDKNSLFLDPQVKQYGSHMVMTNVNKPVKRKYINIDTKYREEYSLYNTDSAAVCNITLPERITEVKTISVRNAEIPMSFYNISPDLGNCYFNVKIGAVSTMVTVSGDNYTSATLISAINTSLVALRIPLTFSTAGNKTSILDTSGTTAVSVNFDVNPDGTMDKNNFKRKLGWALGFRCPSYTIARSSSIISENFQDLTGIRYAYLVMDEFSKGTQNSFSGPLPSSLVRKNIIAKISFCPTAFPFGSILTANNVNGLLLTDRRSYSGKIDLLKFNVQLVDDIGSPIHLNGLDYSFCIEVEHE